MEVVPFFSQVLSASPHKLMPPKHFYKWEKGTAVNVHFVFLVSKKVFPLCRTACAQDEILILPLWLICSIPRPSANFWHRPQRRICCFTRIVYHACICIFG